MMKKKYFLVFFVGLLCFFIYLYFAGRVDNTITKQDIQAINSVLGSVQCLDIDTFNGEVVCIKAIQKALKNHIPTMRCAGWDALIEPHNFVEREYGCCFDRARFLEKSLQLKGFKTRHLAIYDKSQYGMFSAFIPQITSHATLEVLTLKGWMGVDSNENFILISKDGNPLTYNDLPNALAIIQENIKPRSFYEKETMIIYGLYSRHGMFHGLDLPAPEINYHDFFAYNF